MSYHTIISVHVCAYPFHLCSRKKQTSHNEWIYAPFKVNSKMNTLKGAYQSYRSLDLIIVLNCARLHGH